MCSENFADALRKAGAHAELILYEGKTHTDLFVQVGISEPLCCHDEYICFLMVSIFSLDNNASQND